MMRIGNSKIYLLSGLIFAFICLFFIFKSKKSNSVEKTRNESLNAVKKGFKYDTNEVNDSVLLKNEGFIYKNGVEFVKSQEKISDVVVDSVIFYVDNGQLYRRNFSGYALASWFGAKGDGINDDTKYIQKLIDSSVDSIKLDGSSYLVSKNETLMGFPMKDQPCLLIKGKNNWVFNGNKSVIKVLNHAQGILEIQNTTNTELINIHVKGPGKFPKIDGVTGRGEKGVENQGYYTTPFWGLYKNNSYRTDKRSNGGFRKEFPQYANGTKSTWGMWNNGYIGNVAFGILVFNGSKNITIKNSIAEGFNYVGIGVGHNGEYKGSGFNPKKSINIKIIQCTTRNNYEAGLHSMDVDKLLIDNCISKENGHPESKPSDDFCDPGYGYTSRGAIKYTTNAVIQNSSFINNKRKGLDIHAGVGISFIGNYIENNAVAGIYAAMISKNLVVKNIIVKNNRLMNNSFAKASLGAIYIGSSAKLKENDSELNALVVNNSIKGYNKFGINVRLGSGVEVQGNKISDGKTNFDKIPFAISIEGTGGKLSRNVKVHNNNIENSNNNKFKAFRIISVENSSILNNSINTVSNDNELIESVNVKAINFDENQVINKFKKSSLILKK